MHSFSILILMYLSFNIVVSIHLKIKQNAKKKKKKRELHEDFLDGTIVDPHSLAESLHGLDASFLSKARDAFKEMKKDPKCMKVSPLIVAVDIGFLPLVKSLVEEGADLNEGLIDGVAPLSWALNKKHFEIASFLIESGAEVNKLEDSGISPLNFAIHQNAPLSIVKKLISHGALINGIAVKSADGRPIMAAVVTKNVPVVKLLLELSVDVNFHTIDKYDVCPLTLAIVEECFEIVELLIAYGANVEGHGNEFPAPLLAAVKIRNVKYVRALIVAGANVNRVFSKLNEHIIQLFGTMDSNLTALHFSVIFGNCEAAKELLKAGAEVDAVSINNRTALHVASSIDFTSNTTLINKTSEIKEIVQILIYHRADLSKKDVNNSTPAKLCCLARNFVALEELIMAGIDVNKNIGLAISELKSYSLNIAGSVLTNAVSLCNADIVKLCLQHGGDSSLGFDGFQPYEAAYLKGVLGKTYDILRPFFPYHPIDDIPLSLSNLYTDHCPPMLETQYQFLNGIKKNNKGAVKTALQNGAEPRAFLKDLRFPIFCPVTYQNLGILEVILDNGVLSNVQNINQETPLHVAVKKGFQQGCFKLLEHGSCYNYSKTSDNLSPLDIAKSASPKNLQVIRLLKVIQYLFRMARKGGVIQIQTALEKMPDEEFLCCINCLNQNGKTLMKEAIDCGSYEVAEAIMALRLTREN